MKQQRIYVDTSVLGGCFDPEFERWSNMLLEAFRRGDYLAILSSVTAAEVEQAPEQVQAVHAELLDGGAELLAVSTESNGSAEQISGEEDPWAKVSKRHASYCTRNDCRC